MSFTRHVYDALEWAIEEKKTTFVTDFSKYPDLQGWMKDDVQRNEMMCEKVKSKQAPVVEISGDDQGIEDESASDAAASRRIKLYSKPHTIGGSSGRGA